MIELTRIAGGTDSPDGTFGHVIVPLTKTRAGDRYDPDGIVQGSLATAEDDWLGNRRGVSCIPAGDYILRRGLFKKHGECFQVLGEALGDRRAILVHAGNSEEDTEGCILVGLRHGPLPVIDEDDPHHPKVIKRAALSSRQALLSWMDWLADVDEVPLAIRWAPGLPTGATAADAIA